MADSVRLRIAEEIAEAGMFFLVIDECKDRAGHEQLSICVRYCVSSVVKERFLGLVRLTEDFSAGAIAEKVLPFLSILTSSAVFLGLTTDGASVLFGMHSGVAARLREIYPWIINLHCTCHRLNLIIGKLAVQVFPSTLSTTKKLHSSFNALSTSDVFERIQRDKKLPVRKIPSFIEVRWESLYELTHVTVERYQFILMTLSECSMEDTNHALTCAGLYHKMSNSMFLEELIIFYKIISLLQALSKMLQKRTINWHQACREIKLTQGALCSMEQNLSFSKTIIDEVKNICDVCSIPLNVDNALYSTRSSQSQQAPEIDNSLEDEISATMNRVQDKVTRLAQTVNGFFNERYPPSTMKLLEGLDALDPKSGYFLSFETAAPLVEKFGEQLNISAAEVQMEMLKYTNASGLQEINDVSCPAIMKLLKFRNTIAVSSSEAERSFSCMNRVKTKLRSLLSDERTSDLTLCSMEREITMSLDIDSLITKFAEKTSRNIPLK